MSLGPNRQGGGLVTTDINWYPMDIKQSPTRRTARVAMGITSSADRRGHRCGYEYRRQSEYHLLSCFHRCPVHLPRNQLQLCHQRRQPELAELVGVQLVGQVERCVVMGRVRGVRHAVPGASTQAVCAVDGLETVQLIKKRFNRKNSLGNSR